MPETVRVGFVGAGFMGQKAHLDNFVTIPECRVVALAEGRTQTAELAARKYAIPKVYPDHRAMLQDADIDAVVAIMPYGLHSSVVPDILRAGKHCLTEKPMCMRPSSGQEMAALAQDKGVVYYVGYMKRSAPATQTAVELIRSWRSAGECGQMTYLRAAMPPGDWLFEIEGPVSAGEPPVGYDGVAPEPYPDWMDEATGGDYNAFINYYIHQVNLIRYLLGEDYRVTYVDPSQAVMAAVSDSGVPVILEMKGYGLRSDWEETYRVVFEQGKIELSIPSPMARQRGGQVEVFRGGERQSFERPVTPPLWPFLEQARHFIRCVQGQDTPRVSPWDAAKDLEIAEQYARHLAQQAGG